MLQNGSLTRITGEYVSLLDWTATPAAYQAAFGTEDGSPFVTIANKDASAITGIAQSVAMRPEWAKVLVRGSVRVTSLTPAAAAGGDPNMAPFAGVELEWLDSSGHAFAPVEAQTLADPTQGWTEVNQLLDVPPGAVKLSISLQVGHATGSADFRDMSLVAWVSTMREDFSENGIDPRRWTISEGKHNVSAEEEEWFDPGHVTVKDGVLDIHADPTAHDDWRGDFPYESGEISSNGKFQQKYGLFEFRLKLPMTVGAWPAAYLLKWDNAWPPEIDVEELSGRDQKIVIETNHYANDYGRHDSSGVDWDGTTVDRKQWHTYSIVWEPGSIAWYFDDIYKGTTGAPDAIVSNVPMSIRINLAVGAYGGDPTLGTWPQDFYCKFANVYQRQDLPLPLYPIPSEEITLPTDTAALSAISCSPMSDVAATWVLADGSGPVKIKDAHSIDTEATFTKPGMYRFKITVAKGASHQTKQLLVYVNPSLGAH